MTAVACWRLDGFRSAINCFRCGRWKGRASRPCDYCGDQPLPHNGDSHDFDRAYGFAY